MSVVGRVYVAVSLAILALAFIWFTLVLLENRTWVEVVLLVPRLDFVDPLVRRRYQMNVAMIMLGSGAAVCMLVLLAMVAPFRIRSQALTQRQKRELEREILELRTLPLRQQEEDEILAAEAHLDIRAKKVMTEKMRRDRMLREEQDDDEDDEGGAIVRVGERPRDAGFQPPRSGGGASRGPGGGFGGGA